MEEIPKAITINNFVYTFKNELINNYFSYRCKYRTSCKIIIKINKDNLTKLLNNSNEEIEYIITSSEKQHKCLNKNILKEPNNDNAEDEKVKQQKSLDLAKNLIFINHYHFMLKISVKIIFNYQNIKLKIYFKILQKNHFLQMKNI